MMGEKNALVQQLAQTKAFFIVFYDNELKSLRQSSK